MSDRESSTPPYNGIADVVPAAIKAGCITILALAAITLWWYLDATYRKYGEQIFFCISFCTGAFAVFLYSARVQRRFWPSILVAVLTALFACVYFLFFGIRDLLIVLIASFYWMPMVIAGAIVAYLIRLEIPAKKRRMP